MATTSDVAVEDLNAALDQLNLASPLEGEAVAKRLKGGVDRIRIAFLQPRNGAGRRKVIHASLPSCSIATISPIVQSGC